MATLEEQLDGFGDWLANGRRRRQGRGNGPVKPLTVVSKRSRLRGACGDAGVSSLLDLSLLLTDRTLVEELLSALHDRLTDGSIIPMVAALHDLSVYAQEQGWTDSPAAITRDDYPGANPQKPITVYTQEEVDLLIRTAPGRSLRWWAFLTTLAETGRRVGEVLGLRWEYLNLSADVPHFALPTSKNGKQQYVPLTKMLRDDVWVPAVIEKLKLDYARPENKKLQRDVDEYPFPWSYSNAFSTLRRHCELLNIEMRGFHNFRHTKATELLSKGVPIQAVASLLGHSSVATTDRIYNHATALSFAHYND